MSNLVLQFKLFTGISSQAMCISYVAFTYFYYPYLKGFYVYKITLRLEVIDLSLTKESHEVGLNCPVSSELLTYKMKDFPERH